MCSKKCAEAEVRWFARHSKSDTRTINLCATNRVVALGGGLYHVVSGHVSAFCVIEMFQPQCYVEHLL